MRAGERERLGQVGLTDAGTLAEIQKRLRAARTDAADELYGGGWLFDAIEGGAPTAAMIDAAVSDMRERGLAVRDAATEGRTA